MANVSETAKETCCNAAGSERGDAVAPLAHGRWCRGRLPRLRPRLQATETGVRQLEKGEQKMTKRLQSKPRQQQEFYYVRERKIILAAEKWFRALKPFAWSDEKHISAPACNTTSPEAEALARAVAHWLRAA